MDFSRTQRSITKIAVLQMLMQTTVPFQACLVYERGGF